MLAFLVYVLAALFFLVSALGIHAMFNNPEYEKYFPSVNPDLFWMTLIIAIVLGILGRIFSRIDAIEKRMDQANVTKLKTNKDLGNWPPSVKG